MKEKTQIPYYLGIDAGSSSVGWAVTDTMYHVLKTKGKAVLIVLQGVACSAENNVLIF